MERFDVVDEKDNPTGKLTTKAEAHEKGILHRCVAVFVFDRQGRLYLQPHLKGLLDHSVGGHVRAGEDYMTAALRESEEELGLGGQDIRLVATSIYSDERFLGVEGEFNIRPLHVFGLFECYPEAGWRFEPNAEVASLYPEKIEVIVDQMNREPGKFTPAFLRMMAKYIELKSLSLSMDFESARSNWIKTRG